MVGLQENSEIWAKCNGWFTKRIQTSVLNVMVGLQGNSDLWVKCND